MNRIELLRTLQRHLKLSERRSPIWEQNRIGKALIWFVAGLMICYLIFIAIMLSLIVNSSDSITGYEFMYGIMPFILTVDFLLRFIFQQTPAQLVKPYALIPISKYACVDCFLLNTLSSSYNLIWMAMFVPYSIMSVVFSEGFPAMIGFLLGLWLLMLVNAQWYLLARSFINRHLAWWVPIIGIYVLFFSPLFIGENANISKLCNFYAQAGEGFTFWHPLFYIGIIAILCLLLLVNRMVQHHLIWEELGKTENTSGGSTLQWTAFNDLGEIGEYLKLEVKGITRNKNLRKSFIFATALIIVFSLLLSYTDMYDSMFMRNFWCIYCFALYGAMILIKVMCYEGNFIDALMVRKEKIILLLQAKYYFYSVLLILPLLLMLPTVFTGKCTLLMLLSYAVFTAGVEYFLFLQMAVYNKQTMPLNTKFIGKGSMENNWLQVGLEFFVFFFPIAYISLLQALLPDSYAYLIILLTGLVLIVFHKQWLRNIYRRMMLRRYENLDSFRASR